MSLHIVNALRSRSVLPRSSGHLCLLYNGLSGHDDSLKKAVVSMASLPMDNALIHFSLYMATHDRAMSYITRG